MKDSGIIGLESFLKTSANKNVFLGRVGRKRYWRVF
jgi:hypothetical protein